MASSSLPLDTPTHEPLSRYLMRTARSFSGESATVEEVLERIGERGLLVMCIALCVPFLVPVSIPGVSTVFGFAIALAAIAVASGRVPWLPRRTKRLIDAFEIVMECRWPTIQDITLPRWARAALKTLSAWRYALGWYARPVELEFAQRLLALRKPKLESL